MKVYKIAILLSSMVVLVNCSNKFNYDKMVEEGLSSGVRYDSLFLGISLGMTDSAFFAHCWKLNKENKVYQGSGNTSVLYKLREKELSYEATMNFYPEFVKGKISKMPVVFSYEGWAPWNKELSVDMLLQDVLNLLTDWYGDGYMEIKKEETKLVYIKVDGNRRITLYKKDESSVVVFFTDLSVENDED